jgi:hypothetical protein
MLECQHFQFYLTELIIICLVLDTNINYNLIFTFYCIILDASLDWVYSSSFGIMQRKLFKISAILFLVIHATAHLICIGHLVATFDALLLVKYGTVFIMITTVRALLVKNNPFK